MYFYEFVLFVLIAVKEDAELNGTYQYHNYLVHPEMDKITFLIGFVNLLKIFATLPQSKQQQNRQKKKQCDIFEIGNFIQNLFPNQDGV